MKKYYAGIGARIVPERVVKIIEELGFHLAKQGYVLRSGHAEGCDNAFEKGCDQAKGEKEIYLPWKGFNHSDSSFIVIDNQAYEIAAAHHPYWNKLSGGSKKLQARNSHQLLGQDLKTPVEFVICYTEKGLEKGGTGQAIRIANAYHIPVINLGSMDELDVLKILEDINNKRIENELIKMGGVPITLQNSSNTIINIFEIGDPEINDEFIKKREIEIRKLMEELDKMSGEYGAKEYATEKLKDLSFFDGQPEKWKKHIIPVLEEYANK